MGPRFSRLVHAALSAGTLVGAGCPGPPSNCDPGEIELPDPPASEGDGAGDPPVLLDAEMISATVVQLRFSKALAPVNDVEPLSFRISLATTRSSYYSCDPQTLYQDLGTSAQALVTSIWNVPGDLELVRLSLSTPITPAHCNTIDNAEANGNEGGLFVHYAAGDGASVQDQDGNPLADIAAPWVRFDPGSYGYYGTGGYDPPEFVFCAGSSCTADMAFPNMDSYLPIPCVRQ